MASFSLRCQRSSIPSAISLKNSYTPRDKYTHESVMERLVIVVLYLKFIEEADAFPEAMKIRNWSY